MTRIQLQAIWELCREGYPMAAYAAERSWRRGMAYQPDDHCRFSADLHRRITQCNREIADTAGVPTA